MKIPSGDLAREQLYTDVANDCLASRNDRIADYDRWRSYYLFGCPPDGTRAIYNKIQPQMDLLTSFLFASETTKFGIALGESVGARRDLKKASVLERALNAEWASSNADVQVGQAVLWSLVYSTMLVKLVQRRRRTTPMLVDPHSFGVLREDIPFLDDQDAFVHTYNVSYKALDRALISHPDRAKIMSTVSASMKPTSIAMPEGIQRIILSTFPMLGTPSGPGTLTMPYDTGDPYRAKVTDESVEMQELWVWDDDKNDYRIVTRASGDVLIYDRENFFLPGEHDFVQICPNPSYSYFWGESEVDRVAPLQDARETRMRQIMELLSRQVKPPASISGAWNGIPDEMAFAFQMFGASAQTTDPTAKIEPHYPTVPQDAFVEIRAIDEMFNESTGLSNVVQGRGESGVRSKGHAAELARLGSSRIRRRAFIIEDSLDKVAGLYLKLKKQHDPTHMVDEDGHKFIANQFTEDYEVHVDAHTSSPIFVEDQKQLAFELFKSRAITRKRLIEMTDPPRKQQMLADLPQMEAAEAKQREAALAAKGGGKPPMSAVK